MKKIIAANWKMHKTVSEARETSVTLKEMLKGKTLEDRSIVVFPAFISLPIVSEAFAGTEIFEVGGQNFYPADSGAFTGEISLPMLQDAGAKWIMIGHSERRHVLGESDAFIAQKTACALENGWKVMFCIGETLVEREAGQLQSVLQRQLETALNPLSGEVKAKLVGNLAIAYEPVWAIGTGKVAGPEEVLDAHKNVRQCLASLLPNLAEKLPILYGGSVKPDNASGLLLLDNVNGLLVGGASLEAQSFQKICEA